MDESRRCVLYCGGKHFSCLVVTALMTLSSLSPYLESIFQACLLFPLVAAVFTLPFMVVNYRRFGGIALMRVLVMYSFVLYTMCAFLLTVLPLPSREAVAAMAPRDVGLVPFRDFAVGLEKAGVLPDSWLDAAAWGRFFVSKDFFQIAANVIMQIPLGFYLRYYFRCGWKKTLLVGFCVSLFYEVTQYTGLFFIYPHAYRFAEVDDLINNTLGAMIGYGLTPFLARMLPTREEIDRISYDKGRRITLLRRVVAAGIDLMIYSLLILAPAVLLRHEKSAPLPLAAWTLLCFVGYFALLPALRGGKSPGHALLKLRVVRESDHQPPSFAQLLTRYMLLYVVEPLGILTDVLAVTIVVITLAEGDLLLPSRAAALVPCALWLMLSLWAVLRSQRRWNTFPHGHYSHTRVVQERETIATPSIE